jgi:hypothetical protein
MYPAILVAHSWLRWVALVAGVLTLSALFKPDAASAARAERTGLVLLIALDVQMLLGLLLYFALSPFTTEALKNMGAAMQNPALRFFAVDHIVTMFGAVILVHVGRVLGRSASSADAKRNRLLICIGFAVLAMLAGIPWPGMAGGRPLFRF